MQEFWDFWNFTVSPPCLGPTDPPAALICISRKLWVRGRP